LDQVETEEDVWLIYEAGSHSLSNILFSFENETRLNGEKTFRIAHSKFYRILRENMNILSELVHKVAEILDCLTIT